MEITDPEVEARAQIENPLTNHLWRFLRDGKYFRKVELLPGTPQPDDLILKFVFERYQTKWVLTRRRRAPDVSDYSASLTLLRSDGTVVREVRGNIHEEHRVGRIGDGLWGGMKARTQLVEDLLQKALLPENSLLEGTQP